jgi:hypothetical protein
MLCILTASGGQWVIERGFSEAPPDLKLPQGLVRRRAAAAQNAGRLYVKHLTGVRGIDAGQRALILCACAVCATDSGQYAHTVAVTDYYCFYCYCCVVVVQMSCFGTSVLRLNLHPLCNRMALEEGPRQNLRADTCTV